MNRTIEITVADDCKIVPIRKCMQDAIGYLSMWGNSDHVILSIDKDYNISASHLRLVQHDPSEETTSHTQYYFIMGVYDAEKDTYSFHS